MAYGRPAKRKRTTPPTDGSVLSKTIAAKDLFTGAADWDLEENYAQKSQKRKRQETTRLPIKTAEGRLENFREQENVDDGSESFLGSGREAEDEDEGGVYQTPPTDDTDETPKIPLKRQILLAKEELARIAGLLNEDPEEHAGSFKKLYVLSESSAHPAVRKLAMATQVAVYKDLIPGYRIRAYRDEDTGTKVSKEVRKTRQCEQALVAGYQEFVRQLAVTAKAKSTKGEGTNLRSVAISCACNLLLSVPHFNFRTELLNIVIRELSSRKPSPEFSKCLDTLESFFASDEDGAPSLEAVSLLTKMMKAKDYHIQESVLATFFHLRLLSELSSKSSTTRTDKPADISKLHGKKIKKEKFEHRSKKERKIARERKAVEKDFKEADTAVGFEEREKAQSETLKLVFVSYFRILKARIPELMGAVLEGLAKYAHLINQDFFGDILEALKDIVNQAQAVETGELEFDEADEASTDDRPEDIRNRTRESLLSTQTAFTLLSSQDVSKSASALHLDLSFFTSNVYRSLYQLSMDPDVELGPKALRLPDPHATASSAGPVQNKVNVSTPVLLLARALTSILLTPSTPPSTVLTACVSKRLLTTLLQTPEKSTLALLSLLERVSQKHPRKIEALWYSDERKGDGIYHGESESVEATNVFAVGSGVWEGELLRAHYCPKVRDGWREVEKGIAKMAHT